jgi:tetratricopeptide (TPR) repeat protein
MVLFDRPHKKDQPPDDAVALAALGDACISRGEFAAAVTWFDKALDKDPQSAHAFAGKGLALRNLGRTKEALDCYAAVLQLDAAGGQAARRTKGVAAKAPGVRTAAAVAGPDAAGAAQDLLGADAWYDKAVAYGATGEFQKAVDCFDRVLEISPGNADAWYNKGRALGKLGKFSRAIASFDRTLALRPDNPDAWYYKGTSFVMIRKIPDAYRCFEKVVALQPGHEKARAGLTELAKVLEQVRKK